MDPRLLVVVIAIASSLDFALVVGTPPTMMAYATGFFGARDVFTRGVVLDFVALLILSFDVLWIWQLLGVVTFWLSCSDGERYVTEHDPQRAGSV